MFDQQLGWDLLQLVDNDRALVGILTQQLAFIRDLGREGKVAQTRVIARRGG
jgi:hypothetical protein